MRQVRESFAEAAASVTKNPRRPRRWRMTVMSKSECKISSHDTLRSTNNSRPPDIAAFRFLKLPGDTCVLDCGDANYTTCHNCRRRQSRWSLIFHCLAGIAASATCPLNNAREDRDGRHAVGLQKKSHGGCIGEPGDAALPAFAFKHDRLPYRAAWASGQKGQ